MISLSCSSCQKNLKVKPDLAGKRIRCPQCKETMEVPTPTVGFEPGRPGFSDEATIPPKAPAPSIDGVTRPSPESHASLDSHQDVSEPIRAESVYEVSDEIARGGMGTIMRAVDQDIRREVAVKFLLNQADERQKARFVEEAQITGQLEHPNIVPIHQLGVHADGRCFFSMKMVKGRTLSQFIHDESHPATLSRLLGVFISICNAMAYAHSRRVIHRDLKPANIMVGDFGEVYVMDWGLAKVLGHGESTEPNDSANHWQSALTSVNGSDSHHKVTTQRQSELTQAGSIMGTPAYMPPEQAQGDEVDQRADIYALGAILYEMMTLTPPVGRGSDMMDILMRVYEGKIDPPMMRAPERAKAGWIPPELSAIAIKSLEKNRDHRYQRVEDFKHDIERYLEGRSVSAKHDSAWETFKKLVKRNKGVSAGIGLTMMVLLVSLVFIARAWWETDRARQETELAKIETDKAYYNYRDEQEKRKKQARDSVPALVGAARYSAENSEIESALDQLSLAVLLDPEYAPAYLLMGQIRLSRLDFAAAAAPIERYLELRPNDTVTRDLLRLASDARIEDGDRLNQMSEILVQQKVGNLANGIIEAIGKLEQHRSKLLPVIRQRINAAWPGLSYVLTVENGDLKLSLAGNGKIVRDLTPLRGMPLNNLNLEGCTAIDDLTPLKGMPLNYLNLKFCTKIRDLTPIKGMPLTTLLAGQGPVVSDITPLKGMQLTSLSLRNTGVSDLTPLQDMPLVSLDLFICRKINDITPLKGMPLLSLDISRTNVSDLSVLKQMQLNSLAASECKNLQDLMPLRNLPLKTLSIDFTAVTDLTPLHGMDLEVFHFTPKQITAGLECIRAMKSLKTIGLISIRTDMWWPPEEFWKKFDAKEFK